MLSFNGFSFYMKLAYLFLVLAGVNSAFGNLLLKKASMEDNSEYLFFGISIYFIYGLIFYGINVILFALSLRYIPVSIGYPILAAMSSVFLIICSNIVLAEPITINKVAGIMIIIIGIFVLYSRS